MASTHTADGEPSRSEHAHADGEQVRKHQVGEQSHGDGEQSRSEEQVCEHSRGQHAHDDGEQVREQ